MPDKIKPKNPLLEDLENKEIVPTGTTDKLIFRGNNPFNVWRGSQYLTPQYTPGRDYIAYSNGENIWRVPLEKIYPVNDDDLTPQQRLERDWRKSPAYGFDKAMLYTLLGGSAALGVATAAPALASLATAASDAAMATRAGQAVYQGLTSPVGKAALSSVFGGMGMHNFFSDNGYAKTLQEWDNLKNDPNLYNAVNFGKSALGDAMDVTMMAPLYKPLTYMGKEAWNAGRQGVDGAWNWAAQHGNDYARARQLSKLFNSGIEKTTLRSNPRYISQNGVNYSLYDSFGEPIGNAMIGDLSGNGRNMVHSIRSARKNAHKVSEDIYNTAIDNITSSGGEGLESGWDLLSPHKTLPVTEKFPHLVIGESQGHDVRLLTGTTERPLPQYIEGNHYLDITPKTKIQFNKETGKFENVPVQTAVEESPTLSWEDLMETKDNATFLEKLNAFANKYGYDTLPKGNYSREDLNAYAKAIIDRHNSFYRGVEMPTTEEDLAIVRQALGDNATKDEILQYVATHGKPISPERKWEGIWVSPKSNAFVYGKDGTARITRPYTLGEDRMKWFDVGEGDYPMSTAPDNWEDLASYQGIIDPWQRPQYDMWGNPQFNGIQPNEVGPINQPMIFRNWADEYIPLSNKTADTVFEINAPKITEENAPEVLASLDTDNAYPINKQLLARAFEGYNPSEYKGPNISSSKYNIEIPEYKVNFEDILTPEGKKLIEDTRTLQEKMLSRSLNSATSGENPGVKVTKALRKADSDIDKMNTYHDANVEEYNQVTGANVTSVPFRIDRSNRQIKMLPKSDFIELAKTWKTNSPSSDVANIGGVYSRKPDTVYLKSDGTPSNGYHEFLHSNHYGETNPEVTEWRINQLIDPEKIANLSDAKKKYYLSSSEFPVHLRQFGENKGIEVGQPYPGDYAFDSLMFGQNGGFSGASTYAKGTRIDSPSEDKQLLWRALNGTLFGTIPTVVLGTLYETSQNGNAHAYGGSLNTYKSWNDLSVKEKSEMMKVAIRNGVTNLADIKAKYNEFAEGGYMTSEEDNDVNMYGNGSQMNRNSWRSQHQGRWFSFLKRKGLNDSDALRLSGFFTAQDGLESAGGTSSAARQKNNFGGMQRNGKNISYPSAEAYMEDKWNMMNSKFKSALGARTIDEYATILGNPDTAGKGYLYYVTDQAKYDPKSPAWRAAQTKHMHNYINGMRSWAGQGTVKFNDSNYSYNQGNWPQGYVYDVLPQLFAMDGVPITVSSGYRPGAVVKGTNRASRHGMRQAADIVGDFAKIQQVLDNPYSNVSRWMLANGYGYLNETSGPGGTTKHWKDHNRDHSHYHIGMDSSLAQQYASRFKGMNLQPQMQQPVNPFEGWEPSNPQAFYGNPEQMGVIEQLAQQNAQMQAAFEKQEADRLLAAQQQAKAEERALQRNRTNLALQMVGMMGSDSNDNSYFDMWKSFV